MALSSPAPASSSLMSVAPAPVYGPPPVAPPGPMSVEPPQGSGVRPAMRAAGAAAPGAPAPAGGLALPSEGIGQAREAQSSLDTFYRQQQARLAAQHGTGGGVRVPERPEREQRISVQRQRSEGWSPETQRELEQLEGGPPPLELQRAPGPRYSAREILALTDAPAAAKTDKQRAQWAQGLADDLSRQGISLATAEAQGLFRRAPPRGLNGEQVDEWEKRERAERGELINAIDARTKQSEEQTSQANALARARSEQWTERYGAGGMQGLARAGAAADKRVSDAVLGTREIERAEEGAGQMVRGPDGEWTFAADQDREVWHPGAIEQKGEADAAFQERRAKLLEEQQAKTDQLMQEIDRTAGEAAAKVDPKGFWKDKSTADQIMIALAQAMGAFASTVRGGPNFAVDIINRAVDKDVEAQIANINEKRGKLSDLQALYKRVLDDTGNKIMAADAMRLAAHGRVDTMLSEVQAQAGSEKAALRLQEVNNLRQQQLVRERAALEERRRGTVSEAYKVIPKQEAYVTGPIDNTRKIEEILQKRAGLGGEAAKLDLATGNVMADAAKAQAAAQGKERPVLSWDGREFPVRPGVPDAVVTKAFDSTAAGATLLSSLKELEDQQSKVGANTINRQEARMLVAGIVGAPLNVLVGGGAMSTDEANRMIDNLTDQWSGGNAAGARKQVAKFVRSRVEDQIKAIRAR